MHGKWMFRYYTLDGYGGGGGRNLELTNNLLCAMCICKLFHFTLPTTLCSIFIYF